MLTQLGDASVRSARKRSAKSAGQGTMANATAPPVVACGRTSGGQQPGLAATSSGSSGADALTARSVIQYTLPNPKVPGSSAHARYDKYCIATTLAEARALGALSKDIQFDRQKGYIHEEKKVPQRRLSSKQRA